jgi:hypothetical protein
LNFSLDLSLMGEWAAIGAALTNLVQGGVIFNNDRVKAFTCGERLNAARRLLHRP